MDLVRNRSYFVSATDTVLRDTPAKSGTALNHLIMGDWMRYLGEDTASWARMKCRNCTGWVKKSDFNDQRLLEINFVDIGQGDGCHVVTPDDEIILIDAGEGDNMYRFLSWRYNLRRLKVIGVDGVVAGDNKARPPVEIEHVVITHPDQDHYYGFRKIFDDPKVKPKCIYHSGIVERPIKSADKNPNLKYYSNDDLGGYLEKDGKKYIWDVVQSNAEMHDLIVEHQSTSKRYLSTLRAARANNPSIKFVTLNKASDFVPNFEVDKPISLKVLGPITESLTFEGKTRRGLVRLGAESISKNGHSVVLQLKIGKLKVMLGGDLNTESEDHLLHTYGDTNQSVSDLECRMFDLQRKGTNTSAEEAQELAELESTIEAIVTKARRELQVDVTKACHHGSHHFSETFIRTLNPIVTVISSGDGEAYSHPRPDAIGAFGKYGRGIRPLIFSTELARSTKEFTDVFSYFERLKEFEARIEAATSSSKRKKIEKEMQEAKDRNVVVYGMITLRTDGEKVIMAQKIEAPTKESEKWDIHELEFNADLGHLELVRH